MLYTKRTTLISVRHSYNRSCTEGCLDTFPPCIIYTPSFLTQEQVQFQKSFMNLHTIPHTFTGIWLIARVYTFDTTILIC
jgi:hypothetical protein